ncbi:GntR family transcriptional regulator [Diaminobutyricibacter tongyongensis]|uniref:GntR family transcriptional regulator n=1 Tax=Leifsonia tongyongensis TaxID=1268043 RepID=A0A6L9Y0V3_9MICO|nr:GntR family transcriptional regulator [Diaminobutyricibacter tongyongensis]NEN07283.1 GntR family transcriptional regulator [Diaminobutyricibacter tongyongensis]
MNARVDPTKKDSLSRQTYLELRRGIILGQYPQGSRLAEQRLAEELDISRVPLREAVPQLEMDGFVQTFPRRGTVVTSWDTKRVNDLFDLRLCLEVGAARYAAREVAGGTRIRPLQDALRHSQNVVHEGDPYEIAQASVQYHETVVELTDNALMKSLMRSVSGQMLWLFYLTSQLDAADAFDDHVNLCDAIASGNERVAEAVAYAHIERDRIPSLSALTAPYGLNASLMSDR